MANEVQIDIGQYVQGKAKGIAKVIKINGQAHYTQRRFDPESGKPTPINTPINRDDVAKAVENLQAQLDGVKVLLADIDAAQEVITP